LKAKQRKPTTEDVVVPSHREKTIVNSATSEGFAIVGELKGNVGKLQEIIRRLSDELSKECSKRMFFENAVEAARIRDAEAFKSDGQTQTLPQGLGGISSSH
jgi:hypothetical protein